MFGQLDEFAVGHRVDVVGEGLGKGVFGPVQHLLGLGKQPVPAHDRGGFRVGLRGGDYRASQLGNRHLEAGLDLLGQDAQHVVGVRHSAIPFR
ncbi:hypothetical protein [Streptomyces graminofaciens]|uniref:hypothetical protein n=1 Tax=Streptomyces graminofaciens TaxID=68212 RepID=UPI00257378FF|nr:hypothetical protein [Streptomyces graminofaciens]